MKISKTLLTMCLSFVLFGYGQKNLTGKVVDFNNKPVANAKIFLDSIDSKVLTNKEGYFEILIPIKASTVNVYSDEYGLISTKFNNKDLMNFTFLEADKSKKIKKGSEISIVYSKTDEKYVAVQSNSKNATSNKRIYNTIYDMIKGKLAGVQVSKDNHITIRGFSSVANNGQPLFVVDGNIVSNIDYLTPNNVKSMEALKGAEASIYGSRGSNGAIVITTIK